MAHFATNPRCSCARCRLRGLIVPVILVTGGILLLLQNLDINNFEFRKTFPVLFIVAGVVMVLQRTASTEGHIPYGYNPPIEAPPPIAPSGEPPSNTPGSGNEGVHNG